MLATRRLILNSHTTSVHPPGYFRLIALAFGQARSKSGRAISPIIPKFPRLNVKPSFVRVNRRAVFRECLDPGLDRGSSSVYRNPGLVEWDARKGFGR